MGSGALTAFGFHLDVPLLAASQQKAFFVTDDAKAIYEGRYPPLARVKPLPPFGEDLENLLCNIRYTSLRQAPVSHTDCVTAVAAACGGWVVGWPGGQPRPSVATASLPQVMGGGTWVLPH